MKLSVTSPFGIMFIFGAIGYPLLELLWRGRTHWTMSLAGGICTVLLLTVSRLPLSRPILWLLGALSITAVEFAVGCIVNRWLDWGVWDYSKLPLNVWGQISLPFSLLWFVLSIPGIAFCRTIDGILLK